MNIFPPRWTLNRHFPSWQFICPPTPIVKSQQIIPGFKTINTFHSFLFIGTLKNKSYRRSPGLSSPRNWPVPSPLSAHHHFSEISSPWVLLQSGSEMDKIKGDEGDGRGCRGSNGLLSHHVACLLIWWKTYCADGTAVKHLFDSFWQSRFLILHSSLMAV